MVVQHLVWDQCTSQRVHSDMPLSHHGNSLMPVTCAM